MKPEAQRIAIAEACGWTEVYRLPFIHGVRPGDERGVTSQVPDYPNNLDAMHLAVHTLHNKDEERYIIDLWTIACDYNRNVPMESCAPLRYLWRFINATAAQRAEAFLRTIGKWEATTTAPKL